MLKHLTPVILLSALTACSTPMERRQANGNEDYLNAGRSAPLVIPQGLKTPTYSREYSIPPLGPKADPSLVGNQLDIRPPLQILPMAEGTHVEEGSDNIKIVVESVDSKINLKQEIFDYLQDFLNRRHIGIARADFASGKIDTDWIQYDEVIDSNLWGDDKIYQLRQKYEFDVQVRPHGRTGAIVIKLLAHEESYNGNKQDIALTANDKRRYTIDMLNSAVAYMSLKRDQATKAREREQSLGIHVALEQGEQNFYLADADFDKVWNRLRIVLPEMGFDITDMDRSKDMMFLSYDDNAGFWSSLWNDTELPLEKGNYRLMLERTTNNEQTRILLRDISDKPLDNKVIDGVYKAFSELMSEDRKVR